MDAPVANNLRVGAAVGYGTDRTRLGDDGSASSGSMSSASVYASWKPMPALFIDAVGGYGRLSYNQSRWVGTSDMASALRSGSQWFASLAATTEVKSGQWKLAPYIRADFQSLVLNASSEQTSSVSGLTFDKVKTNSFALATGFRTSYSIPMEWGTLTPNLRMEYRQAFDKGFSQNVFYNDLGADSATAITKQSARQGTLSASIGVTAQIQNNISVDFDYGATLGVNTMQGALLDQTIRATTRLKF